MQGSHPVCGGIDAHAAPLPACLLRVSQDGQIPTELVAYGTTYRELGGLGPWRQAPQGSVVALESTGVYWKPVSHGRSERGAVVVANGRDVRPRPGKKTVQNAATWIADLLAHGLIQPSFVPPPQMRA
jgi:hypothetical protein